MTPPVVPVKDVVAEIPRDHEATLSRARAEADVRLERGEETVLVCRSPVVVAGVTSWRYFCLDLFTVAVCGGIHAPIELVETIPPF